MSSRRAVDADLNFATRLVSGDAIDIFDYTNI